MAYMIHTTDKPGSESVRALHRAEHYAFLERHVLRLIASGGLQDDAGAQFVGATILLDCETRAEAEAFVAEDPFTLAELFDTVKIVRWKPAFVDGKRVK